MQQKQEDFQDILHIDKWLSYFNMQLITFSLVHKDKNWGECQFDIHINEYSYGLQRNGRHA